MNKAGEVLHVWKKVFRNWRYVVLLLIVGFVFYLINGVILNIPNILSVYGVLGFFGTMQFLFFASLNFISTVTVFNAVGVLILSVFVGALISLLVYRFSTIDKSARSEVGKLGSFGMLLGVAAPGCVACGVGLLSLLGLTSALAILPFQGHEVIVLAVGLVGFSVVNISRKLYNPVCKLKFK